MSQLRLHDSRLVRRLFIVAGFACLLLGAAGVLLPVLPTTPFILLAAACFARGSAHFHGWLVEHHLTGPLIRDWYLHRSLPLRVKRWALLLMAVSFGSSILVVKVVWLQVMLGFLGTVVAVVLWRIPARQAPD